MRKAAVQLGMDVNPSIDLKCKHHTPAMEERIDTSVGLADTRKDYFIQRNGVRCAGSHLIVDLWGAQRIDELGYIEETLRECIRASGATLLHIHLHHFTPNGGVSGVAVLAESHISVHTWPESGFAAFDVFMCGDADPHKAVDVLKRAFEPVRVDVGEHLRGRME